MTTLNLDPKFVPFKNTQNVEVYIPTFPSGFEHHVTLPDFISGEVMITHRISCDADIMKIMLVVNALRHMDAVGDISLFIPYLPYARQDRVMNTGESFSLELLADEINMCRFKHVYFFDVHSDVATALVKRSVAIPNHIFIEEVLRGKNNVLIVSPDAGSYKKLDKLIEFLNKPTHIGYSNDIVACGKVRDVSTGRIKRITVDTLDLGGKDCYIIDDICDGGATFILLAEELKKRNAGKVCLVVSHGIFSKGTDVLREFIDGVFTTNSIVVDTDDSVVRYELHDYILGQNFR